MGERIHQRRPSARKESATLSSRSPGCLRRQRIPRGLWQKRGCRGKAGGHAGWSGGLGLTESKRAQRALQIGRPGESLQRNENGDRSSTIIFKSCFAVLMLRLIGRRLQEIDT